MSKPSIRFKDNNGDNFPDWKDNLLGNLGETYSGLSGKTSNDFGEGKPFIQYMQVYSSKLHSKDFALVKINDGEKQNKVQRGDIFFTISSEGPADIGMSSVMIQEQDELYLNSFCFGFRPKSLNTLFPEFSSYLFRSPSVRKDIVKLAQGSTRFNMSKNQFLKIKIKIPSFEEQQKIASFLTPFDDKINLLTKKKELLDQYKKGVMQKIFSQEIRFKDDNGNDFPDWEENILEELIEKIIDNRGKTPPIEKDGIYLIEVNALRQLYPEYNKVNKFVSTKTYESWFRQYLKKGDVLFSTVGQTALCSIYNEKFKSAIAQNIVGLRFKIPYSLFMYYLLTYTKNNLKFKKIQMGAVQPSVKVSQMVKLSFSIPQVEEQKKIADFLYLIDKKAELVRSQIDKTKEFKKGLLQQMFV